MRKMDLLTGDGICTFVITVATRPAMRPVQSKNMWKLKGKNCVLKLNKKQGRIELLPVRDETKGVGPDPVEELDEGKGEIKKKKAEEIPRVGISQDEANPVALQ